MNLREQIVAAARSWIGTPYHPHARLKGVGVDCPNLLLGVYKETGLIDAQFELPEYGLHPDGVTLMQLCERYMLRVPRGEMLPGDAVVTSRDVHPQHLGILAPHRCREFSMIHAACDRNYRGRVVEMGLEFSGSLRFVAAFRLPGMV